MALLVRQIWALTKKNLLIALVRHWFSTPLRAFLLPVIFIGFLSYARNLFIPPSHFGIGTSTPVRSLSDALDVASGGRNKVVFVHNGFQGGDIERVINTVSKVARDAGRIVEIIPSGGALDASCRSTLRGTSSCIAAAEFFSSPSEGPQGKWNYSVRADGALGSKIVVTSETNDAQIYALPLQHAVDFAIARANTTIDQSALPDSVQEYPFTSETQAQRRDRIRVRYMGGIIDILGVAFFIGIVGTTYQLTGLMASEREIGMSQLLDCMMPNAKRWQTQAARLLSLHFAFDLIYAPGWIVIAIILSIGVFAKTSVGVLIVFHILAGLSLSSLSLFGAAFFKKAQLSGISAVIICLLLGVLAQVIAKASTGAVAILSLLFPPMTYTFFIILLARWERQDIAANLTKSAPENPWKTNGITLWVFLIIQIFVFPLLAAFVERSLYGTGSKNRTVTDSPDNSTALSINQLTKEYRPSWFHRNIAPIFGVRRQSVLAVNGLNLTVHKGQIAVLLGANGSGKSTTLDAIAGLTKITSGAINLDGHGGFGLCPQKNVLWADLTVKEHVDIFNKIKSIGTVDSHSEICELIGDCDMERKIKARAKTLSGGQKRKLQLAMMFTGGSKTCCVDEVSSGLDPISRRKIWDILLAERGKRTIVFTSHFLDEADLLSDYIAILSKGVLKAHGTAVELKHKLGSGYRVHIYNLPGSPPAPHFEGIPREGHYDQVVYSVQSSAQASHLLTKLENEGVQEYQVSGPTIEDVFLRVAEEIQLESNEEPSMTRAISPDMKKEADVAILEKGSTKGESPQLVTGVPISLVRQAWVLFRKRGTILRRNYLPYAAAFLIPIVAAGLVTLYLDNFTRPSCIPEDAQSVFDIASLASQTSFDLVVGPSSKLSVDQLTRFGNSLPGAGKTGNANLTALLKSIHMVDTLQQFNDYISHRYANVTPGGFFLGEGSSPPTFAWKGNGDISLATITQNALDVLLTNVSISSQYQSFDIPWAPGIGKALQLITYFGLAMACYPAFFALYPTVERLRHVRSLHFSNGVRSAPLWLAYVAFDFVFVLISSILVIVIFRGVFSGWYHIEYLFVVFFLYGLSSTLLSYVISLFSRSQLAAFAFAAGYQAVMFLLYFIAYMSVLTYAPTNKIDTDVDIAHFVIGLITPAGNLIRAMFVALNVFSIICRNKHDASYPGEITLYGGPILYLIGQSAFLFGILLWWDSGPLFGKLRKALRPNDSEQSEDVEDEVMDEVVRVNSSNDGLRLINVTKNYGRNTAVDGISFGVPRGEVFALLGPNGAGKSTTISMIRGDILPSRKGGEIFVENISVIKHRAAARSRLGVCPQFDACDVMSVIEHLRFYARIRGVPEIEHNVREVIRAVGLEPYVNRMAAKLSGGNKRKLSLGIALMGNPTCLLLDEPSSGMDAAAKRNMWQTLASVVPGRSLIISTHSMEEADNLANRAGIMAGKMLALGTTDYLRRKHGNAYHVHLVHSSAPHTDDDTMQRIRTWVQSSFEGAVVEDKTYHGQLRFSVPANSSAALIQKAKSKGEADTIAPPAYDGSEKQGGIASLFTMLERHKQDLGFEYYSVSQTTLDQVFLTIVGKHNVEEENYREAGNGVGMVEGRASPWLCCF